VSATGSSVANWAPPIAVRTGTRGVFTIAVGFLGWYGWFFWATLMLLVGLDHPPTVDPRLELDPARRFAGWLTVALFVGTFIPVPIIPMEGGAGPKPDELIPAAVWFGG